MSWRVRSASQPRDRRGAGIRPESLPLSGPARDAQIEGDARMIMTNRVDRAIAEAEGAEAKVTAQYRWLVIGINCHTGKRGLIVASSARDTAKCHKIDLEAETPRRFAGVTIEYGNEA